MSRTSAQISLLRLLPMSTAMFTSPDTDVCPRAAAFMVGLAVASGARETASEWLLELIAWMAFDRRGSAGGISGTYDPAHELRC